MKVNNKQIETTTPKAKEILSKRLNEVTDLRDRLREVVFHHLQKLEDMTDEELSAKDRIELIVRVLPFITNKLAADRDSKPTGRQSDPLDSI
jgi:hypothetical protein